MTPPTTQRPMILLVDDDLLILRTYARLLRPLGYVTTSVSALDAMGVLERGAVDVVVSDLHMPGMTGLELYAWLAQRPAHPPFILHSADLPDRLPDAVCGVDKGTDCERLLAAVASALEHRA